MVRFLVVGDLHGRKPIIKSKKFDYIIIPGDVCDDRGIKPINKLWVRHIKKARERGEKGLDNDEFMIQKLGKRKYEKLHKQSLKRGREILEYLNSFGKPVLFTPGNWDQSYGPTRTKKWDRDYNYLKMFYDFWLGKNTNSTLIKGLKNVYDCQYKLHKFKDFNVIGYGLSSAPEEPSFKFKFKISKDEQKKLRKPYKKILNNLRVEYIARNKKIPTIFITHNVPYNTKLDVVLDKDSYAYKKHLGSYVGRWFCEKYQPLVCIGGHIHEHHGKTKIGKTVVINAGYSGRVNTYFDIEKGRLKNLKFIR